MSAGEPQITRLPQYFPTTCKPCADATQAFFTCFEANAFMKDETDRETAAHSLEHCQPQLRAYMKCMEENMNRPKKPWWRII